MSHTRNTEQLSLLSCPSSLRGKKRQAASVKLDKGPNMVYSGIITDGNARLAQLNASPSRIPGISGRQTHSKTGVSLLQEQSGRRHLPGVGIKSPSFKRQAERKSPKLQATSNKRPDF